MSKIPYFETPGTLLYENFWQCGRSNVDVYVNFIELNKMATFLRESF